MTPVELRKGDRFRAFPGRRAFIDGEWRTDVIYRVIRVRRYTAATVIYYRVDDGHPNRAQAYATLPYLIKNGLEIVE